jgi:hypothetical protein
VQQFYEVAVYYYACNGILCGLDIGYMKTMPLPGTGTCFVATIFLKLFFSRILESLELEETATVPVARSKTGIRDQSPQQVTTTADESSDDVSPAATRDGSQSAVDAGSLDDDRASLDVAEIEADAARPEPEEAEEEEVGRRKKKKKKKTTENEEEEEGGTKKKKKKKKKSRERGEEEEPADTVIDISEIPNFRQFFC